MNLKVLGATGIQVSELAIGTWKYHGGVEPLQVGIEGGATFIDTAESYGTEQTVGEAILGIRSRVFVASKVSPRHFRYNDVIRAAECSLRQLKTDYLDLYQLHWPNYTVALAETMAAMERLADEGKIRFIGLSNFSVAEMKRAQGCLSRVRVVSNQVKYSLVCRDPEDGLLDYCKANRVSLLAFSPLATGPGVLARADGGDVLGQVAAEVGKTRAQVALNWCVARPEVIAIFKADRAEHVRENCAASGWYLSSEQLARLSRGVKPVQNRSAIEQFGRRVARRLVQYAGRSLGNPTAMDVEGRTSVSDTRPGAPRSR